MPRQAAAMRGWLPILAAGLLGATLAASAGAADRPISGTDRLAQPANPAPLEGSRKRFIKAEPSSAPRLSARPERSGPILPSLPLRGHRDVPPQTATPLKPGHTPVNPPPLNN
jgi:hypothetical protein